MSIKWDAETASSIKAFQNWDKSRDFLITHITQLSERKHFFTILWTLQKTKQMSAENILFLFQLKQRKIYRKYFGVSISLIKENSIEHIPEITKNIIIFSGLGNLNDLMNSLGQILIK